MQITIDHLTAGAARAEGIAVIIDVFRAYSLECFAFDRGAACIYPIAGLEEAYERAKMTGEMYLTGQGAFLYTKLLVNDMVPQKGLISSDMLDDQQVEQYIAWANDLGITYTIDIKEGCKFDG